MAATKLKNFVKRNATSISLITLGVVTSVVSLIMYDKYLDETKDQYIDFLDKSNETLAIALDKTTADIALSLNPPKE